jgi:hypothetical protein
MDYQSRCTENNSALQELKEKILCHFTAVKKGEDKK